MFRKLQKTDKTHNNIWAWLECYICNDTEVFWQQKFLRVGGNNVVGKQLQKNDCIVALFSGSDLPASKCYCRGYWRHEV